MDDRVWVDNEQRSKAINEAALHNAILNKALTVARVNSIPRSVAIECAVLMLCEANKTLFDHAVDAESRAVPRYLIQPAQLKVEYDVE